MAASSPSLSGMRPTLWALLVVAPAVVAYLFPGVGAAMAYDRPAILAGEPWRLITGHWVHFSASHLVYDGLVVAVTGWLIESRGYRCLALLCLLSALAISAVMWIGLPEMAIYGGLSGVAMATTVYLAVRSWLDAGPGRGLWLAVLALCVGKLVMDASMDHFALVRVEASQVVAVPLSHLTGAGAGMLLILWHTLSGRLAMHRRGVLNGS